MIDKIKKKKNWQKLNEELAGTDMYFYLTPLHYSIIKGFPDKSYEIKKDIKGIVLDLGAGKLIHKKFIEPLCKRYISLDISLEHPNLDILGDIELLPFKENSFDTIYCVAVLEHCRRPWVGAKEIARVLKNGGKAIVSVPHIFYVHGGPDDYFRFTKYGIMAIFEDAGLNILSIKEGTGFIGFLISIPMIILASIFYYFKPLFLTYLYFNKFFLLRIISKIDQIFDKFDKDKIFALGYTIVVGKE